MHLELNIKGLCNKFGIEFDDFLSDLDVENVHELTVFDLEAVCEEYEVDLMALLFKPMFRPELFKDKLSKIKLLILDVDGVMTDGGMYVSENGDQMKRYNTQDGMGIMHLTKSGFQVGIISSGFTNNMVQKRAELLGIQNCYVGRDPKLEILNDWCQKLNFKMDEVAIIGDDINDLEVMKNIGLAICPANAVNAVKTQCHIVLSKKGGDGCVREFIDNYLLNNPLV
ncbi:MAG: HAD-IIIA family hydrolase [Bacteroidetes bacterium]|nr:HAD-IIIA family hydrolase [Bacteroidota bacterium]